MTSLQREQGGAPGGSLDGAGAGDHDQPYRFGYRPRTSVPYPFNTRQYARLLVLRGRLRESFDGQAHPDIAPVQHTNLRDAA
jgi:hypothetical protein